MTENREALPRRSSSVELYNLRAAGDLMQSSLSRIAEWIDDHPEDTTLVMPYEVRMALLEGRGAVERWTNLRKESSRAV